MKSKYILAGALAIMALASCSEKEENFTLENTYHLDKVLVAQGEGFNDDLYTFTIELAEDGVSGSNGSYTGTGMVASYQFYGSKYYLESAVYPSVAEGSETDGSYVAAQSTIYEVSNGKVTAKTISDGYVYVSKDNNNYRFGSTTRLSGGEEFKFVSGCTIDFPKLPKYKYISSCLSAYETSGNFFVDLSSGVDVVDGVKTGNGYVYHLEFAGITNLPDGTYNPGDYIKGFLNDTYAAWGAVWDEGSRIIAYEGTANSAYMYLTTAVIRVSTLSSGDRRIEIDCDDVVYIYEGAI